MIPKDMKPQLIALSDIVVDRARNVRDTGDADYDLPPLIEDIALRGQQNIVKLERIDGVLYPITGNRRTLAMQWLANNADPNTGKPFIDPKTGKPFTQIRAEVYEGLSALERMLLLFDHGQARDLSAHELFTAVCRSWAAGLSDKELVKMARGLLERHYPPERTVADNDQARLEYWKGALQQMRWGYESPDLLREAYERKLRGFQKWPTKKELHEGLKIHEKEVADDKAHKYSREKPGPQFLKWWEDYSAAKIADLAAGNRPKPKSMMNRQEVENVQKMTNSRLMKIMIDFQLRELAQEGLDVFSALLVRMEEHVLGGKTLTPELVAEYNSILDAIVGTPAAEEPTEETTADAVVS